MAFEIGETVGDYQIVSVLGAGGMGKVYKVKNTISDRVDAMKVLLPSLTEDQELADRFTREIKVLASLNHPNIAGLRTAFRLNDQLLMIMEYVEGKTLDDMVKAGPVPVPDAVNYITQVLGALGYAHKHGVVHRDIKPANMMLTTEGVIKLMDFGIAKTKNDRKLTQTGGTLGSLFYMSTEQVQGEELDGRSDLYSLGVSLYELVTGSRPFKGKSEFDIMIAQLQQAPMPPIQMMPDLPKALNDIIVLSLEKDKNKRFQTAEAFSAALASIGGLALNATPMHPGGTELMPTVMAPGPGTATAAFGAQEPPHQPTAYMAAATASQVAVPTVQAPAPMPAPDPSHGVPAASGSKSYRGLYMTLGAVIALAVIILAATQLPRFMKTQASSDQTNQSTSQPAPNSGTATNPATTPAATAAGGAATSPSSTPDATANGGAAPAANGGSAPGTGGGTTPANSATNGAAGAGNAGAPPASTGGSTLPSSASQTGTSAAGSNGSPKRSSGKSAMNGASAPNSADANGLPGSSNPVPSGAGQSGQTAAQANPASAQEMAELTDLHDKLSVRAVTANSDVEALRRQMAASGNNLRSDISASQTRMKMYMDRFDAAMNAGDAAAARKNMSLAEREIEKIEKFLGH